MVRLSNGFVGFINIITLLLSLLALGGSVFFYINHGGSSSACQKTLQQPLLFLGCALFVISLLGLVGSCCRVNPLLWIYLFFMFVLIVGMICFTVFTIMVTNKGVGKAVSGRGFKEYRLGDFSNWLQNYAVNDGSWPEIKSCLVDSNFCSNLGRRYPHETAETFNKRSLSPTQSGCCKPPTYCGYEYKNATFWTIPKTGAAAPDTDCKTWSNNQEALCYDCKSCKAGFLASIKKDWRLLAAINSCILVFIILVYSIGCCALRNNRYSKYKRGYA